MCIRDRVSTQSTGKMSVRLLLLLTVFCVSLTQARWGSSADWVSLEITWTVFDKLPITQTDAINAGWKAFPNTTCHTTDYRGIRYFINNDLSAMLLYNAYGQVSGIQAGTKNQPLTSQTEPNGPWHKEKMANGTVFWTVTMYFRDPTTICSTSIPKPTQKIGDRLTLADSGHFINLPLTESAVKTTPLWVEGKCFASMGKHYWYNLTATTDCNYLYPVFLLYNNGDLDSFGWVIGKLPEESGPRWEHPYGNQLKLFLPENAQPACLFADGLVLSTQHIYFDNPYLNFC
eukprot:TRINITY_DN331_c0_g1_i2.p1 TRINITY_DN331_c0_g1~~TRINITY_DN331_c0_g1_i2.p1  ORF type:complete len:288 (-),score=67.30 TRINITY_DN331_c0_g1_i2:134-997(-)